MVIQTSNKQRGAVVISLSVIFLLLTTFVTLYVTKAILLEQKIINNEVRSKKAFEAAEYGISAALQYISKGADRDLTPGPDLVFDIVNGVGTSDTSLIGDESVKVKVTAIGADSLAFTIVSQGFSDDKVATRTITKVIKINNALPNAPDNPLTARGSVTIGGSANVYNPEGNSTIWSGGNVGFANTGTDKTFIADPSDTTYPGCMDNPMTCSLVSMTSANTVGLDVIEQDGNLANMTAEEMFENFFGMTPEKYKAANANEIVSNDTDFKNANLNGQIIWYEGDAKIGAGTLVGCTGTEVQDPVYGAPHKTCPVADELPSIVIFDGNLDVAGSPSFYGIVFIMGEVTGAGTPNFHGAVVSAGGNDNDSTGSFSVWYNSRTLGAAGTLGPMASAAGGWKDF